MTSRRPTSITLSNKQRTELTRLARSRLVPVRLAERARIILLAADGRNNQEIAKKLNISRHTAARWRDRFAENGLTGIEKDATRPGGKPRIDAETVREILRKTCEERPPAGNRWSTRKMAEVMGVSPATVQRIWKAESIYPHKKALDSDKHSHDDS